VDQGSEAVNVRPPEERAEPDPGPVVRAAPGVAAMFAALEEDGSRAVLDLGPAVGSHLRLYRRFARWVRILDMLSPTPHGKAFRAALEELEPLSERGYDLVLCWDLLDRLLPEERPLLIERLAQVSGAEARVHVVIDVSGEVTARRVRFTLLGLDRVSQELDERPQRTQLPIMPAEVDRLLAPFKLVNGYAVGERLREYVAVKEGDAGQARTWWPD
jgi:hypothetical protein